jgi:hypothetical protein
MTVFADGEPKAPTRVAAAGREIDELVRLNGQWLIKLRETSRRSNKSVTWSFLRFCLLGGWERLREPARHD